MTFSDYINGDIPEYYDTMYLDGYKPEEILMAMKKYMVNEYLEDDTDTYEIQISGGDKKK